MTRTSAEWEEVCKQIKTGYAPGGKRRRQNLYEYGQRWVKEGLRPLGLWVPGDVVVDVGSGNGRVAMGLVGEDIEYHGVEIAVGAVEFCRTAFEPWPNFQFHHIDVCNKRYNKGGTIPPERATIPLGDGCADLVLAVSLFSHLETHQVAGRYIHEVRRVLRHGGMFYSTWFRSPPNEPSEDAARTVYREAEIINLLCAFGFGIRDTFKGLSGKPNDQWVIVAQVI